ncbi:MAG: hypothetical protein ABI609_12565 [Acidobacteriota bacterium]
MKVEHLTEARSRGGLVRFFEFSPAEFEALVDAFSTLANGHALTPIRLAPSQHVTPVGFAALELGTASTDRGIEIGDTIRWFLTADSWSDVVDRAGALDPRSPSEFQWLDETGATTVLLSLTGRW